MAKTISPGYEVSFENAQPRFYCTECAKDQPVHVAGSGDRGCWKGGVVCDVCGSRLGTIEITTQMEVE